MNIDPKDQRRFQFLGPGDGIGSIHKIIDISKGVIVTWTCDDIPEDPTKIGAEDMGYSWLGNDRDFFNQFKRLK